VTIAPDTPLGLHDVRLVNKWGISNPRAFAVGDLPEVLEKEPNNDVNQAQRVELAPPRTEAEGDLGELDRELERYRQMLNVCKVPSEVQANIFGETLWRVVNQ